MKIDYLMLLWGKEYIDAFMGTFIKSLLVGRNLAALRGHNLHIYSRNEDIGHFTQHTNWPWLMDTLDVHMKLNFGCGERGHRDLLKDCVNDTIINGDGYAFSLLTPDVLYSDGYFTNSLVKLNDYDAVAIPIGAFRANQSALTKVRLPMTGRAQIDFFLDHMHQESAMHFHDSPHFVVNPGQVLFRCDFLDNRGFQVKSFYHQTVFTRINGRLWQGHNFELNLLRDLAETVHFIKDSDEACALSFKPDSALVPFTEYPASLEGTVCKDLNRFAFQAFHEGYRAHTGEDVLVSEDAHNFDEVISRSLKVTA